MFEALNVACLGNVTLDHLLFVSSLPALDEVSLVTKKAECLGGRGAIVALVLAALNVPVSLVTVVGSRFERDWFKFLQEQGVTIEGVVIETSEETTSEVYIAIGEQEQNTVSFFLPKNLSFSPTATQQQIVSGAPILYLTTHNYNFNSKLLSNVDPSHKTIVFNFSSHMLSEVEYVNNLLNLSRVLICNASDWRSLQQHSVTNSAAQLLARHENLKALVITHGKEGVTVHLPGDQVQIPVISGPVLVPTGLGDAFSAGVVYALARGQSIVAGAQLGVALAAESASSPYSYPVLEHLKDRVGAFL